MKKKTVHNSVSPYCEYLLFLHPDEALMRDLQAIKQAFANRFRAGQTTSSRPHITLARFTNREHLEQLVLRRLTVIADGTHPFPVWLKGFGGHPYHTIYLKVANKAPLATLITSLRSIQKWTQAPRYERPSFPAEPHLSVARALSEAQYKQALLVYEKETFHHVFSAKSMLLLKRSNPQQRYEQVAEFFFKGLPEATQQGNLFAQLSTNNHDTTHITGK